MIGLGNISGPNSYGRANETSGVAPNISVTQSLATTMPSERQTSAGLLQVAANKETLGDYQRWKRSKVFHPKQAPMAITSENFLKAKAGMEPEYLHSISATKLALMSVIDKDKPRYSEQINILA